MKTSKNSIKAIILTITFFLFIIFISLFKGIYLYNIKINNTYIKKLFLKIDNKIVLKIYDIKITNNKNYTKQALNLHQTILTVIKYLNIFQNITINSLYYGKTYIKQIELKKNKLNLNSDFLAFSAVLNPKIKNSFINFEYIKLPKQKLMFKNTIINLFFSNNKITAKGSGEFEKNKFQINLLLSKDNLSINIYAPQINYNNFIKSKIKNLSLNSNINLNYYTYNITGKFDYSKITYQGKIIKINNAGFKINNKKILFKSKNIISPFLKNIENIYIKKPSVSYNFKSNFLILNSPLITANYDNFSLTFYKNSLIYQNIKNLNLTAKKIIITKNKYRLVFERNLLNILDNYTLDSINNGEFSTNNINLKSSQIFGNLTTAFTKKIFGKVYGFNVALKNTKANIKNKSVFIKNAEFNKILINDIKYKNKKITLNSKNLFDKNVKEVLKKFLKVNIPILQLAGKNHIVSTITLSNNIKTFTKIKVATSLFKLFAFDIFIPQGEINITNNQLDFITKNAKLYLQKDLDLSFWGKGTIDFKTYNLLMNGKVNFKIDKIINLKDFNETVQINFAKKC